MKLFKRKILAGVLAVAMAASLGSTQLVGAQDAGTESLAPASSYTTLTDKAIANSMGLDNQPNNLERIPSTSGLPFTLDVNCFSGNLTASVELIPDNQYPPMGLTFTYNSMDTQDYGFGPGFRTNFNTRLIENEDGTYTYYDQTGTPYIFRKRDEIDTQNLTDIKRRKAYKNYLQDGYSMYGAGSSRGEEQFDQDGYLTSIVAGGIANNRVASIDYRSPGRIETVTCAPGNLKTPITYKFGYGSNDKITSISIYVGEDVVKPQVYYFEYDENNLLCNIIFPDGNETKLVIDPATQLLRGIDNQMITFDYMPNEHGKIANVSWRGSPVNFFYGNYQTILQGSGGVDIWKFDQNGNKI